MKQNGVSTQEELKDLSLLLSAQPAWQQYDESMIYQSVTTFCTCYPHYLENYIRENGVYGCRVRTGAARALVEETMTLDKQETTRITDIVLAERLAVFWESRDEFVTPLGTRRGLIISDDEAVGMGNVLKIANQHANYCNIEGLLLQEVRAGRRKLPKSFEILGLPEPLELCFLPEFDHTPDDRELYQRFADIRNAPIRMRA